MFGFDMKVNVYDPFVSKEIIKSYGGKKIENLDDGIKTLIFINTYAFE